MAEPIVIRPFEWAHWAALWQLVETHLIDQGIVLDSEGEIPPIPPQEPGQVVRSEWEWDLDYIGVLYLRGAGGFWLAWQGNRPSDTPVGHVGAQDLGAGGVELRRMYVRAAYRRRGIGTRLVQSLIEHCAAHGARAIELWTERGGLGHKLYAKLGFRPTEAPGPEYGRLEAETGYQPGKDETRMRLDLA